ALDIGLDSLLLVTADAEGERHVADVSRDVSLVFRLLLGRFGRCGCFLILRLGMCVGGHAPDYPGPRAVPPAEPCRARRATLRPGIAQRPSDTQDCKFPS